MFCGKLVNYVCWKTCLVRDLHCEVFNYYYYYHIVVCMCGFVLQSKKTIQCIYDKNVKYSGGERMFCSEVIK